jgi:hypothetical protein
VATDPGEAPHEGYFWLAFYWRNFRLSCHRANRLRKNVETGVTGGKGDRFPLNDPANRLRTQSRADADLDGEQPLLLDPTRPRDVVILTFTQQGYVALHPAFSGRPIESRRLEASRVFYNLDFKEFRDARVRIYNIVKRKIEQGNRCAPPQDSPSYVRSVEFDTVVAELRELMERNQCFSSAARAYIMTCRDSWWVDLYVLDIIPTASAHGGGTSSGSTSN